MCRERTVRENDVKSMLNASDLQRVSAWYQTADMNHHRVDSREVDHERSIERSRWIAGEDPI